MKWDSGKNSSLAKKNSSNKLHKKLVLKVLNRYAQSCEKHTSCMVIDIRRLEENKVTAVKGPSTVKEWHLPIVY